MASDIVDEGLKRSYSFSAVTNGYDLHHFTDLLGPKEIRRLQITLDGEEENHNRNRRSGTFSGGMMRRLGIAQAILTNPEFLIVDEPTVGLDPEERIRFRDILGRLSRDRAILISTHIVGDISSTCKDLAILNRGQLIFRGSPLDLISKVNGKVWQIQVDEPQFEKLSRVFHLVTVNVEDERMSVRMVGDGEPPADAETVAPNLEDAYLYFMGGDIADETAA